MSNFCAKHNQFYSDYCAYCGPMLNVVTSASTFSLTPIEEVRESERTELVEKVREWLERKETRKRLENDKHQNGLLDGYAQAKRDVRDLLRTKSEVIAEIHDSSSGHPESCEIGPCYCK